MRTQAPLESVTIRAMNMMTLQDILYTQGFGTRRVCAGLVQQGFVAVAGVPCTDSAVEFVADGLRFSVQGVLWEYHEKPI